MLFSLNRVITILIVSSHQVKFDYDNIVNL